MKIQEVAPHVFDPASPSIVTSPSNFNDPRTTSSRPYQIPPNNPNPSTIQPKQPQIKTKRLFSPCAHTTRHHKNKPNDQQPKPARLDTSTSLRAMSSWYSNILTRTTSQISSLRSTLLSSDQDGDTDDDTHVCRVLRNYYTDKGRAFPTWLPPDPKSAVVPQPLYASSSVQQQFGARYGGLGPSAGGGGGGGGSSTPGAGGLSSLWDSAPVQTQQQQTQSLRAGRMNRGGAGPGGLIIPGREDVQARPLPSQRAGSYQGVGMGGSPGGAASAQDRLKQR
ncbi:hypothetical protein E4U12_000253, partial [Claviceps purpurea]